MIAETAQSRHAKCAPLSPVTANPIQNVHDGRFVIPLRMAALGAIMRKRLPVEFRLGVVEFGGERPTVRAAAVPFQVSGKTANTMAPLNQTVRALAAKRLGSGVGHGQLADVAD